MENKPCLSTIRAEYTNLTNREQLLADYILQNYEKVVTMTTAELAKNAGTVKSVVIRLCQSLGFAGYTEFKLLLSRELARNEQFGFTPYICKDDHPADILKKIFSANIKTLHDTLAGLDMDVYHAAVAALDRAENIYVYGVGTSTGIAADFHYRLIEIGRNAFYYTDVVSMRISTLNIQKNDVVLGISNSGRTASTVDVLRRAKERGAQTICVTSYPNSEIVAYSDHPLVVTTDEIQYPVEAISGRIAHISVLDSIAVSLSAKDYDDAVDRAAKNHDLIDDLRY